LPVSWGFAAAFAVSFAAGCASSQPQTDPVERVNAQRIAPDGTRVELEVDKTQVIACVEAATEVPIDRVAKSVLEGGEYELRLDGNGSSRVLTLTNSQNFSEGGRFFETECLYELVRPGE